MILTSTTLACVSNVHALYLSADGTCSYQIGRSACIRILYNTHTPPRSSAGAGKERVQRYAAHAQTGHEHHKPAGRTVLHHPQMVRLFHVKVKQKLCHDQQYAHCSDSEFIIICQPSAFTQLHICRPFYLVQQENAGACAGQQLQFAEPASCIVVCSAAYCPASELANIKFLATCISYIQTNTWQQDDGSLR